jgi:hypothetical protein
MDKASNCIGMVMAIKTEGTFTLKQLLAKLCQKTCDGANCNQLAPYIDVFQLSRRCLSIGNGCPIPLGSLREDCVQDLALSVSEGTSDCYHSLRHFQPYEESVYSKFWLKVDAPGGPRELFWDFADVKAAFLEPNNPGNVAEFALFETAAREDPYWKLCSVQAPWLSNSAYRPSRVSSARCASTRFRQANTTYQSLLARLERCSRWIRLTRSMSSTTMHFQTPWSYLFSPCNNWRST